MLVSELGAGHAHRDQFRMCAVNPQRNAHDARVRVAVSHAAQRKKHERLEIGNLDLHCERTVASVFAQAVSWSRVSPRRSAKKGQGANSLFL